MRDDQIAKITKLLAEIDMLEIKIISKQSQRLSYGSALGKADCDESLKDEQQYQNEQNAFKLQFNHLLTELRFTTKTS